MPFLPGCAIRKVLLYSILHHHELLNVVVTNRCCFQILYLKNAHSLAISKTSNKFPRFVFSKESMSFRESERFSHFVATRSLSCVYFCFLEPRQGFIRTSWRCSARKSMSLISRDTVGRRKYFSLSIHFLFIATSYRRCKARCHRPFVWFIQVKKCPIRREDVPFVKRNGLNFFSVPLFFKKLTHAKLR